MSSKRAWQHTGLAALMLLPAVVLLAAFTHIPAVATLYQSFVSPAYNAKAASLSLDNYRLLLSDDVLLAVLKNSALYALVTVPISIFLALGMALMVGKQFKGVGLMRLAYFTPTILPMIAVANLWLFFYSPEIGLFNQILAMFDIRAINWLGDANISLYSLMAIAIWKEAGFFMIFYLAALKNLDTTLYQAAAIEGASAWQQFWRITWPLLMPTTFFIMINAVLNAFKLVDHLFILTKGGPNNATNLLLYYIYETAFSFFDEGYAGALTVVLLLILIIIAALQFGFLERRVHYR